MKQGVLISLITAAITYSVVFSPQMYAQSMSNEEYILDLNPSRPKLSQSPIPSPTDSPKQTQTINSSPPKLSFSVSNSTINYGEIAPGEPIIRDITIKLRSNTGASVLASENDTLKSEDNQEIPDTTCDEGTCTELISAIWTSPLTYGFGYRCEEINKASCPMTFLDQNTYKQFANTSNKEIAERIFDSTSIGDYSSKMHLKVNIPSSLAETSFSNTIQMVALPKLQSGN
jgi:hypothetical protein